jgi:amino acid transporter/nucleotide-binding universal stress UspA family protein
LASERPRNVGWVPAAGLLFGDWGTSRLYVLGLAFATARRTSFYLILAMSLLILAVGWAYTQICRIYPDGGGVYTAAKKRLRILAVIGALLLVADYTVTASLSALDAFHYFGLPLQSHAQATPETVPHNFDDSIVLDHPNAAAAATNPWAADSPSLWAIVSIVAIAAFNLLGPKHTAGYAVFAALGMIAITAIVAVFGLFKADWSALSLPPLSHGSLEMWEAFVAIVLALSGVEAIANLTGVMRKPVALTARRSIWAVALDVAILNVVLGLLMVLVAGTVVGRYDHREDMLAFMAQTFVGVWGEWPVRIIGGLLLLSATNTAVNGLMSITYVMSRDGELPRFLQKLNGFGSPWIAAVLAGTVPAVVLVFVPDLQTLASLYAIGVVGAVSINISLCVFHPRLRKWWRKAAMVVLALVLIAIEITLALTKQPALLFVSLVLAIGLILRLVTQWAARRRAKLSLLRQAIQDQLTPEALAKPRLLLATAGSDAMAAPAIGLAAARGAALVVCFVREVALSYKVTAETRLSLDTDPAALALFTDFLEHGARAGVPIIPVYDTGTNAAEIIAEMAAVNGVQKVLIGSSRRGVLHQMIKGSFQRKLEALLPPEIPVEVLSLPPSPARRAAATLASAERSNDQA